MGTLRYGCSGQSVCLLRISVSELTSERPFSASVRLTCARKAMMLIGMRHTTIILFETVQDRHAHV